MVKHAILLASEEWCEAASKGKVKVYDFVKPRKKGIHALGPGSVCVVLTKAEKGKPAKFYGEFTVVEVKRVNANEYNLLVSKGLIHKPITLKPGEGIWIILFDEFREYKYKITKKVLCDVKTVTSKKPICEWVITGLSYIDDAALRGIRERAKIPKETISIEVLKTLRELSRCLTSFTRDVCGNLNLDENLRVIPSLRMFVEHEIKGFTKADFRAEVKTIVDECVEKEMIICGYYDPKRKVIVLSIPCILNKGNEINKFCNTLAHELIHHCQFTCHSSSCKDICKYWLNPDEGKEIDETIPYNLRPHEIEAYTKDEEFCKKIKEMKGFNEIIDKIKDTEAKVNEVLTELKIIYA